MSFEKKVIIVTGASSGIGAVTAEQFAQKGAYVVLVGRNLSNLQKAEQKCKNTNKEAKTLIVRADVTTDAEKIINETINKFSKLNVLVNNAGISCSTGFIDSDIDEFDMMMNTNLRAVNVLTKLAVPHLLKTQGNIVNVSSAVGVRPSPRSFNYSISKAALNQFTKCLALELAPQKIRVNSVNPATIETEIFYKVGLNAEQVANFRAKADGDHPIGRIGKPEEVARVILFLASDDSSFITGTLMLVDGGRSI